MTSRPAGDGFGTFELDQPDALGDGPNQPHDESANWRRRLGWSSTAAPIAMLLAAGLGVGPAGINLLTPATLALLDPAVPIALAALGVLVGLGVGDGRAHNWRLVVAACSDSAITLLVVALGIAAIATKITPGLDSTVWMLVSASGICAATSLTLPTADPLEPRAPSIRVVELGVLLPIVIGGVFLSYVRTDRSIVAGVVLLAQSGAVILAVAVAGWLLLTRASSETEERVIVVSALLLGGGAAAALGQSTLLAGLASGLLWRFAGRRPRETIGRDVSFVQHPLLVLVLLVAGARVELSSLSIGLGIGFVLLRTTGKLLGGAIAERVVASRVREDFGRHLLRPGVFGVAFALNAANVAGADAGPLLGTVILGTIGSEFVALVLRPRRTRT
jgi:hypothetical protein